MRPNHRICPTCKAGLPAQRLRGGFSALNDPPLVFYNGERLRLTPMASRMLIRLASSKFISKAELKGDVANDKTMNVHLYSVRRILPAGVELVNEKGKGYRLLVPKR